jgi:hypothetical protein
MKTVGYKVIASDKQGKEQCSSHTLLAYPSLAACKEAAKRSAANCRGKYPWGNRVKIVPIQA